MSRRLRLSFGVGTRQASRKLRLGAWLLHCTDGEPIRRQAEALKSELSLLSVDDIELMLTKLAAQVKTDGYGDEDMFEIFHDIGKVA